MESSPHYDIKVAARYLGVAPSTLRYWEQEGLIYPQRNEANDYRQYPLHNLIHASEIAFYRKLGVSVKELSSYRNMSLEELDDTLCRTEHNVTQRIAELESMQARLMRQRNLIGKAKDLGLNGMRAGQPSIERLSSIEFADPSLWELMVNEPWRYSVIIKASNPTYICEAIADIPESNAPLLWQRPEPLPTNTLECLLQTTTNLSTSNAPSLFQAAAEHGLEATHLIGTYLLTATDLAHERWDYYRAWMLTAA